MQGYVATGRDDTIVVTADPLWGILISGALPTGPYSIFAALICAYACLKALHVQSAAV